MDFTLSETRAMLADSLRGTLTRGADWAALAELGVPAALFTEAEGGYGGEGFDIALVFEELGRAGAVTPLLDTCILAGGLLAECGADVQVAAILSGESQGAFAHWEPGSRYSPEPMQTAARETDGGWRLTGHKAVVVNAPASDLILCSARLPDERTGLFLVASASSGVELRETPLMGGGDAAEIILDDTPAQLLTSDAASMIEARLARACLAQCAEALGLMQAIRDLTLDYLRTRNQFGQPIGRFQALQHRMADMLMEIEQVRSAVINLAGHLAADRQTRERHVSAAKVLTGEVARLVSEESIQMHGGIGLTEEYALGRHAIRLSLCDHRFGDVDYHLARFSALSHQENQS